MKYRPGGRSFKYRPCPGRILAVRSYTYGHRSPSYFRRQRRRPLLLPRSTVRSPGPGDLDNARSSEPPILRASTNEPESSGRTNHFGACDSFVGRCDAYPSRHGWWNGAAVPWPARSQDLCACAASPDDLICSPHPIQHSPLSGRTRAGGTEAGTRPK